MKAQTWYIESGDLTASIRATSAERAFLKCLKASNAENLGRLVRASVKGFASDMKDKDALWISTEAVLRQAGLLRESPETT